ncbi:hypothetical protein BTVI_08764 [Pitangus sulphuratus]|nr:hypothetical protein BTVI_08764 [Pitangus sulphuratus]
MRRRGGGARSDRDVFKRFQEARLTQSMANRNSQTEMSNSSQRVTAVHTTVCTGRTSRKGSSLTKWHQPIEAAYRLSGWVDLVSKKEIGSHLDHSDQKVIEFKISVDRRKECQQNLSSGHEESRLQVGLEGIVSKFADDTKVGGAVDSLKNREALQRDLDKLEDWAIISDLKLNKGKCQILHLGWGNPGCLYRLRNEILESSATEGTWGSWSVAS